MLYHKIGIMGAMDDEICQIFARMKAKSSRMLGGVEITDAVMQNAREMKNLAQSKK